MFGVQLHHSERHWSLASLTNNEGGGGGLKLFVKDPLAHIS